MKLTITMMIIVFGCLARSAAGESGRSWGKRYLESIYSGTAIVTLVPGIRLTYPQGVAVSGTAFVNARKIVTGASNPRGFTALLFQIEPGYGGLKSGVGIGGVDSLGYLSGLKLSHYQAWTDFASMGTGEQYVGLDAALSGFLSSF